MYAPIVSPNIFGEICDGSRAAGWKQVQTISGDYQRGYDVANGEDIISGEKSGLDVGKDGLNKKGVVLHELFCGYIKGCFQLNMFTFSTRTLILGHPKTGTQSYQPIFELLN